MRKSYQFSKTGAGVPTINPTMMKTSPPIVQVTGSYPPMTCGIGDYTFHLSRSLAEQGAPVEIWTQIGAFGPRPGVRECVGRWDRAGLCALGRQLRQTKPAVVNLQYEPGVFDSHPAITLLPLLTRRAGVSLVTTFHSLDGPKLGGRAQRAALLPLLLGSDDIVVCSQRQFNALARLGPVGRKAALIPIGSNIEAAPDDGAGARADGRLRLIYFGFVWRGRNVETVLRALAAVAAERPDVTLEIVGGVRDETYRRDLETLAAQLGVAGRVVWAGDLPAREVSRALWRSDVALLPYSTGVSTGRGTLMASLAHRLPVVTFGALDNLSPLFRHGENMMIAEGTDEGLFIQHTLSLARDAALRDRLADGAARLGEEFSWASVARQMFALPSFRAVS